MKHIDHSTKTQCVLWYHKLKSPTAVQRIVNLEMSLDKTLLTLTALRNGLKIILKRAALWNAKDGAGQALMKRLLMLCG